MAVLTLSARSRTKPRPEQGPKKDNRRGDGRCTSRHERALAALASSVRGHCLRATRFQRRSRAVAFRGLDRHRAASFPVEAAYAPDEPAGGPPSSSSESGHRRVRVRAGFRADPASDSADDTGLQLLGPVRQLWRARERRKVAALPWRRDRARLRLCASHPAPALQFIADTLLLSSLCSCAG